MTGHYRPPAKIFQELGITDPEDIDVIAIAQFCGAMVIDGVLHGCEARLVGTHEKAIITVKQGAFPPRRRFSIGHELGHWMHDRGKANFRCKKSDFQKWGETSPETLANQYAVELLLPKSMFLPRSKGQPFIHATVTDLAKTFQMSRQSTSLRLIELADRAAIVVYSTTKGIKWARPSTDVPFPVKLLERITSDTIAYDLHRGAAELGPKDVSASAWFSDYHASRHSVQEDSAHVAGGVLTLLSWPNEDHLLAYLR